MPCAKPVSLIALLAALLSACASPPVALVPTPSARDRLYMPNEITPGRLEYARAPDSFAPVLTHRVAYPTQSQANNAFDRENWTAHVPARGPSVIRATDPLPADRRAAGVRLFACRPRILNSVTGRIDPARLNGVHCATDFLNAQGRPLSRQTVNYFYDANAWHMRATDAPTSVPPWIDPEPSPADPLSWLPFGKRSTPYNN